MLLGFPGGRSASLFCSIRCVSPGQMRIFGTDGWIDVLPRFHHPETIVLHRIGAEPETIVAPHTGGGPILWFSSIHTATSLTNFYIMESVYHLYNDLYPHFIKNVPVPINVYVTAPDGPGLGIELREEPFRNGDAVFETIAEL